MELRQIASPLAASSLREPSIQDVRQASQSSRRLYVLAARLYQLHQSIALHRLESLREMLSNTLVSPLFAWQRFELFTLLHLGLALHRLLGRRAHLHDLTGAMRGPAITVGPLSIFWGVRPRVPFNQTRCHQGGSGLNQCSKGLDCLHEPGALTSLS